MRERSTLATTESRRTLVPITGPTGRPVVRIDKVGVVWVPGLGSSSVTLCRVSLLPSSGRLPGGLCFNSWFLPPKLGTLKTGPPSVCPVFPFRPFRRVSPGPGLTEGVQFKRYNSKVYPKTNFLPELTIFVQTFGDYSSSYTHKPFPGLHRRPTTHTHIRVKASKRH